ADHSWLCGGEGNETAEIQDHTADVLVGGAENRSLTAMAGAELKDLLSLAKKTNLPLLKILQNKRIKTKFRWNCFFRPKMKAVKFVENGNEVGINVHGVQLHNDASIARFYARNAPLKQSDTLLGKNAFEQAQIEVCCRTS
uniref:Uncharacterized protein n=1 Tax=Ditylenchus dipsaci TaxID=166011 RepID=A0A915DG19_9BILA